MTDDSNNNPQEQQPHIDFGVVVFTIPASVSENWHYAPNYKPKSLWRRIWRWLRPAKVAKAQPSVRVIEALGDGRAIIEFNLGHDEEVG
jgi:hypothetical protein